MKNRHVSERAVSPVVGVMLMLVVTIIIAAVVSAFAGGLGSGSKATPQAVIDADVTYNVTTGGNGMGDPFTCTAIKFKLISGEPLPTKDLSIITYYTNSSGYVYKHEQTASSNAVNFYLGTPWENYNMISRVPYRNNLATGWGNEIQQHFGNFTWQTGDAITTGCTAGTANLLGMSSDGSYLDPDFKPGSTVEIKIKYVPSGGFLFDKEVVVS